MVKVVKLNEETDKVAQVSWFKTLNLLMNKTIITRESGQDVVLNSLRHVANSLEPIVCFEHIVNGGYMH